MFEAKAWQIGWNLLSPMTFLGLGTGGQLDLCLGFFDFRQIWFRQYFREQEKLTWINLFRTLLIESAKKLIEPMLQALACVLLVTERLEEFADHRMTGGEFIGQARRVAVIFGKSRVRAHDKIYVSREERVSPS